MRYLTIFLAFLSGVVCAQDSAFEREFSKFDKDFERLNHWKAETPASKKIKRLPAAQPLDQEQGKEKDKGETQPLDQNAEPAPTVKEPAAKVEPLKHSDLLGSQIQDPVVRKKVQDLYKRPDVIVHQYVLPTN